MIEHNDEAVTMAFVTYVHGHGMTIRSALNPVAPAEHYHHWLEHMNFLCEHSQPVLWMFQGIWPKRNTVYSLVTPDQHAAQHFIKNPIRIRDYGQRADLVPLDPDGSGQDSVGEHNLWYNRAKQGNVEPMSDYGSLQGVSADSVEGFLRDIAEADNSQEEGNE